MHVAYSFAQRTFSDWYTQSVAGGIPQAWITHCAKVVNTCCDTALPRVMHFWTQATSKFVQDIAHWRIWEQVPPVGVARHWPSPVQAVPVGHAPQDPLQPSSPHCFFMPDEVTHDGVHAWRPPLSRQVCTQTSSQAVLQQ